MRQLRTLLAIAQTGSFSKAAELVHLTVSAVGQQVRALEAEVGVVLFDRTSRPPSLTVAGRQMVEVAENILRTADVGIDLVKGRKVAGTLSLGSVRTSALSILPRAMKRLNSNYPELRIRLQTAASESLLRDVAAGRIDAAMVSEHVNFPTGLKWRAFRREPLFVIAPPHSPMLDATGYLTRYPYIRFRSNVPLANQIDLELAKLNLALNEIAEIDTIAAITSCVANGLGVSVVPRLAVDASALPLVTAPFGTPPVFREIGLVEKTSGPRSNLISELHEMLIEECGEFGVPAKVT
ncbi:LysR family transcriptional regulator [Paracoccus laeviglucosivorans]|nr:LysR family transcriptional regulator [Paracoccus laeviglucosivorans]